MSELMYAMTGLMLFQLICYGFTLLSISNAKDEILKAIRDAKGGE